MTPAEATALAREVGIKRSRADDPSLLAFANLIEARVREECAKVARDAAYEAMWERQYYNGVNRQNRDVEKLRMHPSIDESAVTMGERIAAAIRSTDADHIAGDGKSIDG